MSLHYCFSALMRYINWRFTYLQGGEGWWQPSGPELVRLQFCVWNLDEACDFVHDLVEQIDRHSEVVDEGLPVGKTDNSRFKSMSELRMIQPEK